MCVRLGIPLAYRADSGDENASLALATLCGTGVQTEGVSANQGMHAKLEVEEQAAGDPCNLEKASVASSDRSWVLM